MSSVGDNMPMEVGRYTLYQSIGSGGMATVHLGRLMGVEGFGRTVAIKRLKPHLVADAGVVRAFLDEAKLATRIRHPNVVTTLDVVTTSAEVFLVMEYVDGEALSALAARTVSLEGSIPFPVVVAVIADALRGLHAAHDAVNESGEPLNIVHRDVSPQNILVGSDGAARVLDFGVAKAVGRQQTTTDGRIKGKLAYMAPEQLAGQGVTRRTDTFAMGIVLWELLVGSRLFRGDEAAETVGRVLFAPIVAPSTLAPSVPTELDAVVMRALERDPIKRFASAEDMAEALEASVPRATARVVGEWVRSIADERLQDRARQVRDIETHSTTGRQPSQVSRAVTEEIHVEVVDGTLATLTSSGAARPSRPRKARIAVFFSVSAALVSIVVAWAWLAREEPTKTSPVPARNAAESMFDHPSAAPSESAWSPIARAPATVPAPPPAAVPQPAAQRAAGPHAPRSVPSAKASGGREGLYSRD
jgi:eukaryotic-like serine/threonine-protein kinase